MTALLPNPELRTDRLVLEPLLSEHAERVFGGFEDPRLYGFIPQDPPRAVDDLSARFRRLSLRRSPAGDALWLNWVLRRAAGDDHIGLVEATVRSDRTADLAYFIFVDFQRRGFAKEACARVIEHLSGELGVESISATIDTRNAASIALVQALGFRLERTVVGADAFKGSVSDEHVFVLGAGRTR